MSINLNRKYYRFYVIVRINSAELTSNTNKIVNIHISIIAETVLCKRVARLIWKIVQIGLPQLHNVTDLAVAGSNYLPYVHVCTMMLISAFMSFHGMLSCLRRFLQYLHVVNHSLTKLILAACRVKLLSFS